MRICKSIALGLVIVLSSILTATGQVTRFKSSSTFDFGSLSSSLLPPDGWTPAVGVDTDGWNIVDVTNVGISPGDSDVTELLNELIDDVSEPTVFFFPAGEYFFQGTIEIEDDNVVIRGAGSDQTRFILDGIEPHSIRFAGWIYSPVEVTANVAAGHQRLMLSSTSTLQVGDVVEISQELDDWDAEWGKRSWGQIVVVTEIKDNAIKVDQPIALGLDVSRQAEVVKMNPVKNVGIENLYLERRHYTEASSIEMRSVYNGFIRNIESYNAVKYHVLLFRSRNIVVSGNYIHDAQNYGGGGFGYGVNLEKLSTQVLVTDNIFKNLRHHIIVQTGVNNSIISYNYNVDIQDYSDLSLHGHYSNHNLYEGNMVWLTGIADAWGRVGPSNVIFRNQIRGRQFGDEGIAIHDDSDNQALVANDFVDESYIRKEEDVDNTYEEGNIIEGIARWNELNPSAEIPQSLYLEDMPDFWLTELPWPAFGPDVPGSALNKIPAQVRYEQSFKSGNSNAEANESLSLEQPLKTRLNTSFPNPFSSRTTISFNLAEQGTVHLEVFDSLGRKIATLLNETRSSGTHEVSFDGLALPAGTYFYKFSSNGHHKTGIMTKMGNMSHQ